MAAARVWVTGGSGFLGRHIEAGLAALGAAVPHGPRADLLNPAARHGAVRAVQADILVHAAWITRHGAFWDAASNLDWCAATLELVQHFAAQGGRRVVLVGTCAEYDWTRPSRTPWRESRPCRPGSLYGAAKLATWIAVDAFARSVGLSAATARVFAPVGPGEPDARLLPSLIRAARTGAALPLGPLELTRDPIDVRDAGAAIAALALADTQGPVNIGSGRAVSLGELVRRVSAAAGPIRTEPRPPRPGEPLWMVADTTRLRRATGCVPVYSLDRTIADMLAEP